MNREPVIPLDGVDDFTYLAIDIDRSGTPGDSEGEVLINDHGMLYWDALDDGGFPIEQGEGISSRDAAFLQIPDTHMRGPSEPPTLASAEAAASVPDRVNGQVVNTECDGCPEDINGNARWTSPISLRCQATSE